MSSLSSEEFARRAAGIEWLLCDCDGVLTDGGLYYDRRGHTLLRFDVRDGLALGLARQAGIRIGIISGRKSKALSRRAADLEFDFVLAGAADKRRAFSDFLDAQQTSARRVAFIGDDLNDLWPLASSGLSFAPADAVPEVRSVAHLVVNSGGGRGAVRDALEALLKARGDWERLLSQFSFEGA